MSTDIKIVTFNLRSSWGGDEKNSFIHRAGLIYEKMQEEKPDIVAFQEVSDKQRELLEKLMPEYIFSGHGRNEDYLGEGLCTAVKKSDFMILGFEVFWLSPQMYVPASRFEEQSECPRICVETLVRHKFTGKIFRIYNIHLDHIGSGARAKGIQCVLEKIYADKNKAEAEVILLGDFNEQPGGRAIKLCEDFEKISITDVTKDIPFSFHNFGKLDSPEKIDYIFVSDSIKDNIQRVEMWKYEKNEIYISDHYPICAVLKLS